MCGITGIFSKNIIRASEIKSMNSKISHRGPDDEGYLMGGNYELDAELRNIDICQSEVSFAFGHRRLSILDISSIGRQPMNFNNKYWIVFNGEIYNHIELRLELIEKGYHFISQTDTEVIMAAYDLWGEDCLAKFNGMWAFVILDMINNEIFFSRDRFGVKPFYYYQDNEIFLFSSEIKSILSHPSINAECNIDFCLSYLENGSQEFKKETAFKNIFKLNISSYYKCKFEQIFSPIKEVKFWEVHPNLVEEEYNHQKAIEYAKLYYEKLYDAVKLRLRADVKIGSASSGGLDSSSIVYLINQQLHELGIYDRQITFSTVYRSAGTEYCDESAYIDIVTKHLNVESKKIEPIEKDVPNEHLGVIYAMESPPESTCISAWHTFKLVASTEVVVTLDGQGADEQLAGYLPYITIYMANHSLHGIFPQLFAFWKTNTFKFAFLGLIANILKRILGKKRANIILNKVVKTKFNYFESLNKRLHNDTFTNLVTLVHFADHTSMAHSIESRMPFLDYRLVEFLSSIPSCYKIRDGWTKYIARLAFDKKLPDSIVWRKDKMGWPIPQEKWFKGNLKSWFVAEVINGFRFIGIQPPKNIFNLNLSKAVRFLNLSVYEKTFLRTKF